MALWFTLFLYTDTSHGWCPLNHQNSLNLKSRASVATTTTSTLFHARRQQYKDENDYYHDNDSYYEEEQSSSSSSSSSSPFDLKVDMDALEDSLPEQGSGVYYNVYFEGTQYEEPPLDWEPCDDGTLVLLPPTYVSTPRCIVHFVGGTFFGSSPKLWYRALLEGLVQATQCCVVATPIPVSLLKNPLHHVRISCKLQRKFQNAYRSVIRDEYGSSLDGVPIVGLGHSLGARLLTVLATLDDNNNNYNEKSSVPPYRSYILMSFTNYGSAASIPGIQSLLNQSKRLEHEKQSSTPEPKDYAKRRQRYVYNDEDEEWDELMDEFQMAFQQQAARVKTALTPRSKELEFYPSPAQLWKALKDDGRYTIPQTLIVQFENDAIDQSPRLTDCLLESTDIKYARLKGTHLTPISASSQEGGGTTWLDLPSKASKALWKLVRGKQTLNTSDELRDLRQSIARYITDVVAVK